MPWTTKSFSPVTTTCVWSQRQTAAVAPTAATTSSAAPATETGQPPRNAIAPSSGEDEGAPQRTHEDDAVPAGVDVDVLVALLEHGVCTPSPPGEKPLAMESTARRAATATLVALSIVVAALALWKIQAVIALIFLGFTIEVPALLFAAKDAEGR